MKVGLLTSGSIGNAAIIEGKNSSLLIDCGITYKKFTELIQQTCFNPAFIKDILITHEHADHIKGVGTTSRQLKSNIWTAKETAQAMYEKGVLKPSDEDSVFRVAPNEKITIGDFEVTSFPLSHDAALPLGYVIEQDGKKVVVLTDTGYVSGDVMDVIAGADVYILELNHNIEMLQMSSRPWHLKQRILGDYGHLSNEDGAYVLSRVLSEQTKHVFLAHISQEANLPDLAMMTLKHVLGEEDVDARHVNFHLTYPLRPSAVIEI